jgi:flagellar motor switch protein FliM
MNDQILSQEEIDALMAAMKEGEFAFEKKDEPQAEAVLYDLTSQSRIISEQYHALAEVHDKLSHMLHAEITGFLQRSVEVRFVSTEMIKFEEFITAFSAPTSFHVFTMDPLVGPCVLAFEAGLVFPLIDCMFGGNGRAYNVSRGFTVIEQRMMRKFTGEVLRCLEKAWQLLHPIRAEVIREETKPEFMHILNPKELMISTVFSLKGDEFEGYVYICKSCLMLETIKDKLSSRYLREKGSEQKWNAVLRQLLRHSDVDVSVEVGHTVCSVGDLLKLRPNDLLQLGTGPEDPVAISVEGIRKYMGEPGVVKGSRAVKVVDDVKNNGGMPGNGKNI